MMLAKGSKGIKKNREWERPLTDLQVITLDVAYADAYQLYLCLSPVVTILVTNASHESTASRDRNSGWVIVATPMQRVGGVISVSRVSPSVV